MMRRAGGATILRMVAALVAVIVLGTAAAWIPAWGQAAEGPPTRPFLRIDAGFHTEVVNRVAVDGAARIAATASDDKTVRLWSVADGTPLGTLRVPIGEEEEGAIYAVALSPDGGTLLAAGHTGYAWDRAFAVYLFDLQGQRLRGRLPALPAPVNHLAYSPDGSRFALALGGRAGIRVHEAATGKLVFADADYQDRATWVAFDKAGRLAATGFDGKLRLYGPDGRKIGQRAFAGGGKPYGLTWSVDGKAIAVGFLDQPRVEVVASTPDLKPLTTLRTPGAGGLGAVAWSTDGHIIAGGTLRDRSGAVVLRAWGNGGRSPPADLPLLRDTISDIRVLPDGGTLVVSADPALVKIDRQGRTVFTQGGTTLDFREVGERRLSLSADGMVVDVQPRNAKAALRLDMAQRTIAEAAGALDPTPLPTAAALRLTDWRNRTDPKLAGRPLVLDREETARSWAAPADGRFLVLGTDYHLRFYAANGQPVGEIRLPAAAWGVATTPDGSVIVAALGDGTLRWFGTDRQGRLSERLALLLASDLKRWTAWTPEGFFDHADLGGKELLGYQLNRGKGEVPDWFSFAQVYRLFYAPDLVVDRLRGGDAEVARRRLAEIGDLRERLGRGGPPRVELSDVCWLERERETCRPMAKAAVTRTLVPVAAPPAGGGGGVAGAVDIRLPSGATAVRLRYSVADQGGGVGPVDVFIDGRNAGRADAAVTAVSPVVQPVDLGPGLRRIQLRAFDRTENTYAQSREFLFEQAPPPPPQPIAGKREEEDKRPRMFVIVAGVDKYGPQINQLRFAVADARAFATIVRERAGDLYREIALIELYDEAATTESIVEAMAEVGKTARFDDTFLLYLSGHGTAVDKRYYFVPQNVESSKTVVDQGLSETALVRGLAGIKARHGMIFLDTCHAGQLALDSPGQLAHETGRYMLAAATSVQEALDSYDNKNGVFATAVLRGISGAAVRKGDETVSNFDLGFYVKSTVVKLASEKHHQQRAQFKVAADDAEPFPIARVK